jgi:hypothetical protein
VPIQGFTRYRRWQMARQTGGFGVARTPVRAYPWRTEPDINPNWTEPDVETGTLDPVLPPMRGAMDLTATTEGPLAYDDWPALGNGFLVDVAAPTGGGADKTWTHQPSSEAVDALGLFTAEWGDELTSDQVRLLDGTGENLELTLPDTLSAWQTSARWRFSKQIYPIVGGRADLDVDQAPVWVYGADTELFINDTSGSIGTTKIADAVHSAQITIENELDIKRFANGSNSRFEASGYARAARHIRASFQVSKTTESIAEVGKWLAVDPINRFIEMRVTSPTIITGVIKYSLSIRLPGRWMTRAHGTRGGNTVHTLAMTGFYDATGLLYPIRTVAVNKLATAGI